MPRFRRISRGPYFAIADGPRGTQGGLRGQRNGTFVGAACGLPREKIGVHRDHQRFALCSAGTWQSSDRLRGYFGFVRGQLHLLEASRLRQRLVEGHSIAWSWKHDMSRGGGQFSSICADEASDQGEVCELPSGGVPWQPEAVGMSESGLAVVSLKIFGGEHKLAIGTAFLHALAVIPCIDHECALGANGFVFVDSIEHDSSTDTACGGFAGLMQHGI